MPKVTVVTLPAETMPAMKAPDVSKPVNKRSAWKTMYFLLRHATVKLFAREALALNILALMLSRVVIMGEIAPFGLAFFAAVAQVSRERAGGVAIGALAGVLSTGRYMEAAVYLWSILVFYRLADKLTDLPRRLVTVPLLMFAAVTSGGLFTLFWQQVTLYQIILVLFEAIICTIGSYIFMYGVPSITGCSLQKAISGEMLVCSVVILSAAVAGLGTISLWGYSIRSIAGALLVMSLAFGGGPGVGAAVGVASGLVIGLTEGNVPVSIALYSLAGTLAGVFRGLGRYAVILGYLLGAAIAVLGFTQGRDIMLVLAETSVAAVAFIAVPARWTSQWGKAATQDECQYSPHEAETNKIVGKLENISSMFNDLAGAFGQISAGAREKIREAELTRLLSAVGDRVCGQCPRRSECWERDFYRTYQALLETLSIAESPGGLHPQTLPQPLKDSCLKRSDIIETVSLVAERNSSNLYWQKRITESRQMVTEQMRATSSIISTLAAEVRKEPYADRNMGKLIKEKSELLGCELSEVQVTGDRGISAVELYKEPCAGSRECINTVLPLATNLLKQKMILHADCGNGSRSKRCRISMQVASRYSLNTGTASAAKLAGGVSGDTCSVAHLEHGKILMMLSDGMGSGKQAAGESKMAVNFLERLIAAGFDVDVAIKTVNSMLLLRMPEESFATVDMAVIDAFSGDAEFLKIGSAPSFVKRVREVTVIKSATLPIGILNQIEIEPVKMPLTPGDIIVMVSDGISELGQRGLDRENWVANFLRRQSTNHPQELADKLLQHALEMSGGKAKDDMTVLAAVVVERPELK